MILSNSKIDYSTVRRMPIVKFTGQTQSQSTATTTPIATTMPTSTSLQDITAHQKQTCTWTNRINDDNEKEQRFIQLSKNVLSSKPNRKLSSSHSDDRIFEHPEVTIKPSVLDQEIQKRLSILKTSSATEECFEVDSDNSVPNILEHPDMSSPVIMLTQQNSSTTAALLLSQDTKRLIRQQSVDLFTSKGRTPSPNARVDFSLDPNSSPTKTIDTEPMIENHSDNENQRKTEFSLSSEEDSIDFPNVDHCQTISQTLDTSIQRTDPNIDHS